MALGARTHQDRAAWSTNDLAHPTEGEATMSEKKKPEATFSDEMVQAAADVIEEAVVNQDTPVNEVARKALEAAFGDVPMTNYGIDLALQFFDLVICVKEKDPFPAAGVYRQSETDPEAFYSLSHNIDVAWGDDRGENRYIKKVGVSQLPPPGAVD